MRSEFPFGLYIMRHCRTEYNKNHKVSGQSDLSISDFSINTAALDFKNIKHSGIIIICSPLVRCVQTVTYLIKRHNEIQPYIYIDSRIIERGMGYWEGKRKADILRHQPQYCYRGQINPLLTPPNGEAIDDFIARINEFIRDLKIISTYAPILICAHNQSLKMLKFLLSDEEDFLNFWTSISLDNGKVERIY